MSLLSNKGKVRKENEIDEVLTLSDDVLEGYVHTHTHIYI